MLEKKWVWEMDDEREQDSKNIEMTSKMEETNLKRRGVRRRILTGKQVVGLSSGKGRGNPQSADASARPTARTSSQAAGGSWKTTNRATNQAGQKGETRGKRMQRNIHRQRRSPGAVGTHTRRLHHPQDA
ncbi:uncharacterized protein BKA78DRAFT_311684 [Phyllosticta capitalensis]|uniref:uncharacterized protein n=1 Tax=Phyllosticta capitalensis TaxID=121624 RepID=UPI00313198A2